MKALTSYSFSNPIFLGWILSLMITVHITFLPGILPKILEGFQLTGNAALNSAGLIISFYTGTSLLGNYFLSRLSSRIGLRRVITLSCLLGSLFQISLILASGVWSFTLIRMIQMGFIAVVFPLTISIFARDAGGKILGFLNSSRFVGGAVGPLMATSVLAYSNLLTLYTLIAGLTLGSLWAFLASGKNEKI
jgi:MFS family permease